MRGEYAYYCGTRARIWELPPRARRIPFFNLGHWHDLGTTSACAENTVTRVVRESRRRNYLRVRGEYCDHYHYAATSSELPPRARRILYFHLKNVFCHGTTSACAENTSRSHPLSERSRNYLRVRGEYRMTQLRARTRWELPPRARRILIQGTNRALHNGTTSACAENTPAVIEAPEK